MKDRDPSHDRLLMISLRYEAKAKELELMYNTANKMHNPVLKHKMYTHIIKERLRTITLYSTKEYIFFPYLQSIKNFTTRQDEMQRMVYDISKLYIIDHNFNVLHIPSTAPSIIEECVKDLVLRMIESKANDHTKMYNLYSSTITRIQKQLTIQQEVTL